MNQSTIIKEIKKKKLIILILKKILISNLKLNLFIALKDSFPIMDNKCMAKTSNSKRIYS